MAKRWTLAQLAAVVGTSTGYLSNVETGKRVPTALFLGRIADALGVPDALLRPGSQVGEGSLIYLMAQRLAIEPVVIIRHLPAMRRESTPPAA